MRVRVPPSAPDKIAQNSTETLGVTSLKIIIKSSLKSLLVFYFLCCVNSANSQTPTANIYTIPAGTIIEAELNDPIGSGFSSVNDIFTLSITKSLVVNKIEVLPAGTIIEGRVINVKRADRFSKNALVSIKLEYLKLSNNTQRLIDADVMDFPKSRSKTLRRLTIYSTLAGAIGGVTALISAQRENTAVFIAAASSIGATLALTQSGENITIKAGEKLKLKLNKDLTLPIQDF